MIAAPAKDSCRLRIVDPPMPQSPASPEVLSDMRASIKYSPRRPRSRAPRIRAPESVAFTETCAIRASCGNE